MCLPSQPALFTRLEAEAQKGPVTASLSRTTRSEQQTAETILSAPAPSYPHRLGARIPKPHHTRAPMDMQTTQALQTPHPWRDAHSTGSSLVWAEFFFLIEKKSCSCSGTWLVPSGIPLTHPYPLTNLQADTPQWQALVLTGTGHHRPGLL